MSCRSHTLSLVMLNLFQHLLWLTFQIPKPEVFLNLFQDRDDPSVTVTRNCGYVS